MRKVDGFEVGCALLTLLKGGIQWRRLPKDFPKRNTVYSYFVRWKNLGKQQVSVLKQVLKQPVEAARIQEGRPALTSFLMVETQSVKNTDMAERKGDDAGKKGSGIKRHLAVDSLEPSLALIAQRFMPHKIQKQLSSRQRQTEGHTLDNRTHAPLHQRQAHLPPLAATTCRPRQPGITRGCSTHPIRG